MQKEENLKPITIPDPLPSIFPPELPAGLRGEAVRSSLRDKKKGLWYEIANPETFQAGILRVQGSGSLSFLHSKFTNSFDIASLPSFSSLDQKGIVRDTCYLTGKGRTVDTLSVLVTQNTDKKGEYQAHILTSPFHGSSLYNKLSPFVFPMDGIELVDCTSSKKEDPNNLAAFCVISTSQSNAQSILERTIIPTLKTKSASSFQIPNEGEGCVWTLDGDGNKNIYVMGGGTMLPTCAAKGFTLLVPTSLSSMMKEALIGPLNDNGENAPMEISALEWESLRIESGKPAYGREMTADIDKLGVKSNPLELHLQSYLNLEKGCYQGQEGVSSIQKNKRGPPRTLYTVIFDDEENAFDEEYDENDNEESTKIRQPLVGDEIFVLGSNESIQVGVITSVAEPGSTGAANTITLALLRRSDSILKKMSDMGLDFGASNVEDDLFIMVDEEEKSRKMNERINTPQPVDPLSGLEVIIKGTYTMGRVEVIASRKTPKGKNIFDDDVVEIFDNGSIMGYVDVSVESQSVPNEPLVGDSQAQMEEDLMEENEEELARAVEEANKAAIEAEKAAAEAKRKVEKMELLRQRAEAAMARRKNKKKE